MLFAETTHEMTDNLVLTTVESSIDGLYTPEGHFLTENKELDAENEVLGFDVGRQWDLEPAGDDDKGMSNGYLMEEHEMTRRWHDHAVLLIPKEGLLDLVRPDGGQNTSRRPVRSTRDQETHHPGMTPVVAMVVDDLEKNPGGTVKVAENIIDELCDSGNDTQVLCTCINPIVNWCLKYLAKKYQGSEDSIDWKDWLDDITKKPIGRFVISYRNFSRTILAVSPPVWKSFDAWSETIMDEKLDSELSWEYKDLEMILDLIRLRCDNTHWIVNRFVYLVLPTVIYFSQFDAHVTLEPTEEAWLVQTPRHEMICGPFVRLTTECHAIGAFVEASQVLKETFSLFVAEKVKWILVKDPFGVIFCLITPLIRLSADGLWRKIPAWLEVLELLVRKIIRLDLPRQSQAVGGLVFPRDTVWEFNAPKTRRLHIEHAVRVEESLQALRVSNQTTGTSWFSNYSGLEKVLQPLRGHFMRKALGEQRYREIILLEGVTPYGPPLNSAEVRRPPTGDGSQPGKRLCTSEMGAIDRGLPYNQTAERQQKPKPGRTGELDHTMSDYSDEGSESSSVDEYAEKDDAQAIRSVCQQAPFDHLNRTVVDTSVRNTWELDASNFNLVNKNWFEDFSSRILRYTARELGLFELRADPHKLLLHEPGSFFQPHKDSENYGASIFFQQTKDLKSMLSKFRTDLPKVGKRLYPLDHLYTESSLCLRNLKGRDRSIGRYLNEICSEACFYFMFGQTTHFQVDIDDCDEYQDQTILRTLYNLNGDQLSSELVLNLKDFLDYDIRREVPDIENEGGLFGSKNSSKTLFQLKTSIPFVLLSSHWQSTPLYLRVSRSGQIPFAKKRYNLRLHGSMTTDFSSSTLKKRSGDEEWILQTFLQKIVLRAESSLLLFLLQHMSSERTGSFKKFPELYKFTLEHDGQLDFPVEELKSGLITGRWSQGSELPLIKVLEANEAPTIPAVQDFLETALREVPHRPINSRPDELVGWAHKKPPCRTTTEECKDCQWLGAFLEDPEQQ
ncbi:hypothetical protein BKA60DRAFT_595331 [Fusarium oxysporum]|nr:hypothetical protein BKA60DRAFT_595331 [Fusarium oxysporum]